MSNVISPAECLERAAECARDAEAAELPNQRDKFLQARQSWLNLAGQVDRMKAARARGAE